MADRKPVRLATQYDAQQILDIYTPYIENTAITFETTVPSVQEMEMRIAHYLDRHAWLVYEVGDEILGYSYASPHRDRAAYRWSVDVSVYVRDDRHRRGLGKSLYSSLFPLLRRQGYYNAYAGICLPNEASVALHEHLGFQKVAHYNRVGYKLGKWHDVGWWELILQEHQSDPREPVSLDGVG